MEVPFSRPNLDFVLTPVSNEKIKIRPVKEEGNLPPSIEGFLVLQLVKSLNYVIQWIEYLLSSTHSKTHAQYLIKSSPRNMENVRPVIRSPLFLSTLLLTNTVSQVS